MKEFEKWISKAENDLLSISNNFNSINVPVEICCFHAQQAAEKYLKAYLVLKNLPFPKTHDLEVLVRLCASENPFFGNILFEARSLLRYAITPRYPDTADDLVLDDAKEALQNALSVKRFILNNFFE